ncbi:MAG: hypothetical protein AABY06_00620 [Nanoarchaeota archaeon]
MKNLNKILFGAALCASLIINNSYSQTNNSKIKNRQIKTDSFYKEIKNLMFDSAYIILEDENKDKIIDKIIYVYYYPKNSLKISSLDSNYDGFFETTIKRLSDENGLTDAGEFEENLNDISQSFKNKPEGKYKNY